MPKEQKDVRKFLQQTRQKDAQYVKIKKVNGATKFKLRLSKYLHTLVVKDRVKADKISKTFPPSLVVRTLDKSTQQ